MKKYFPYNPDLEKLGLALMDLSISVAIPVEVMGHKWTGIALLIIGGLGRLLHKLYGRKNEARP